ncbi:thioredoxin SoxW [hydrothermal vent metagenome]|uniref:Thioredoxin SoxW n=1 Tax=hydrothermal vent metagenome TaxID=652676 RepID=A0A3B1C5B6_9ZZZZ
MLVKLSPLLLVFCLSFKFAAVNAAENVMDIDLVNPGYVEKPAWFKNSFLDIRDDIREAAANGRRVMLYFYQDGCPYCARLINDNFTQRSIVEKTRKYFDVIAINMWGDREVSDLAGNRVTEKQFAKDARVMFTPTLLLLTEKGQLALRINGYFAPHKLEAALDYVGQQMEGKLAFRDYLQKIAATPASGKLHMEVFFLKPPYNLQSLNHSGKPLLLLFEQKLCQDCDELHGDIFKRKQTRVQLQRFNVIRLDMWADMPLIDMQGQKTTAKKLARALNIKYVPSMLFYDSGEEVIRTEAWLKSFHIQSVMDYVASGAYRTRPEFQRYISDRAARLEAQGVHVDLWK